MYKKNQLIVLMGIPGSGKTTTRMEYLKQYPDAVVISSDDWLEDYGKKHGMTYQEAFDFCYVKDNHDVNGYMRYYARQAYNNNKDVIWDQTNMTFKKRKMIANSFGGFYEKTLHFNVIMPSIAKQRNTLRERVVPDEIIDRMYNSCQFPNQEDVVLFDKIIIERQM